MGVESGVTGFTWRKTGLFIPFWLADLTWDQTYRLENTCFENLIIPFTEMPEIISTDYSNLTAQNFSLFQNGFYSMKLFIRRVIVFYQDTFHHDPHLRFHIFFYRPVNSHILFNLDGEIVGNPFQYVVSKNFYRTVIDFECFIKCQLGFVKSKIQATAICFPQFFCKSDQLFNNFDGLDSPVLVPDE